jgi:uncharacterized protein (DUF924 family)
MWRGLDALPAARRSDGWMSTAEGALAGAAVDQIRATCSWQRARLRYRSAGAPLRRAHRCRLRHRVDPALRVFFYLPLEHSEDLARAPFAGLHRGLPATMLPAGRWNTGDH